MIMLIDSKHCFNHNESLNWCCLTKEFPSSDFHNVFVSSSWPFYISDVLCLFHPFPHFQAHISLNNLFFCVAFYWLAPMPFILVQLLLLMMGLPTMPFRVWTALKLNDSSNAFSNATLWLPPRWVRTRLIPFSNGFLFQRPNTHGNLSVYTDWRFNALPHTLSNVTSLFPEFGSGQWLWLILFVIPLLSLSMLDRRVERTRPLREPPVKRGKWLTKRVRLMSSYVPHFCFSPFVKGNKFSCSRFTEEQIYTELYFRRIWVCFAILNFPPSLTFFMQKLFRVGLITTARLLPSTLICALSAVGLLWWAPGFEHCTEPDVLRNCTVSNRTIQFTEAYLSPTISDSGAPSCSGQDNVEWVIASKQNNSIPFLVVFSSAACRIGLTNGFRLH